MNGKKVRKAVRTFLIENENILVIKYKTEDNFDYIDIPGGKIEDEETPDAASIREFKEETGIKIIEQKYRGNVIINYPDRIFDMDIYEVIVFEGKPLSFDENDSIWININEALNYDKRFSTVDVLKYLNNIDILNLNIIADDNHKIIKIENN